MADPIIPDHYRAMVVFQHPSGIPEERYVNTWYFRGDGVGTHPAVHDNIKNVLLAFYTGVAANAGRVDQYLAADHIASMQLRTYELVEAPPRTPIISDDLPMVLGGGQALPAEVASCLSYRTTRKGPRGRGRVFLGPLVTAAMGSVGGYVRPGSAFVATVADRAADVLNTTENVTWVGLSRMDGQTYEVTGGYVDDAFDTMRKRGPATSSRVPFGGYVLAAAQSQLPDE